MLRSENKLAYGLNNLDLYYQVHKGLIFTKEKLNNDYISLISKTLRNDGFISESPFLA